MICFAPPFPARLLAGLVGLGLALVLPGVVLADVVVHDGGVNRDRAARQVVTARTGKAPHLILSSDVLAGPSRLLVSNANIERCEGRPVKFDIHRKLDQITDKVLAFDLDQARSALSVVDTLLPCSARPVSQRTLARFAFLEGATLLDLGDKERAEAAMRRAAAFDPDYTGERGFPGPHIDLLKEQRRLASSLRPGRLFVWPEPGTRDLFINGLAVEHIQNRGILTKPGVHLLQLFSSTGMHGMWVETKGSSSTLVFPSSGRGVWADGGRSPGGDLAMQLLLQDEFHGREGDIHTIHYVGRRGVGATYPWRGGGRIAWKSESNGKTRPSPNGGKTASKPNPQGTPSGSSSETKEQAPASQEPTGPGRAQVGAKADPPSTSATAEPTVPAEPDGGEDAGLGKGFQTEAPAQTDAESSAPRDRDPETKSPPGAGAKTDSTGDNDTDAEAAVEPDAAARTSPDVDDDEEALWGEDQEPSPKSSPPSAGPSGAPDPNKDGPATTPVRPRKGARTRTSPRKKRPAPGPRAKVTKGMDRRLRLVLRGGYQYAEPFHYALLSFDVSFRIIGVLEVNAFVSPSYGGVHEFPVDEGAAAVVGPVIFVPFGVSVGLRKPGDLSPWVAGGAQVAWNRDGLGAAPYLFGALVHGGLDWSPQGSPLVIRLQGDVGNIGLHFNARISGGVGLRF